MTPTVSVLMPVYNAARYLPEAVESVLSQSFGDFEFVVIDDGSTDASLAVLQRYAARDGRLRIISRPNTGIVGALNDGLAVVRGEFVARMDADDVSLPDRFRVQVEYLRSHPGVVCLGSAFILIDEFGRRLTTIRPPVDDAEIQNKALSGHTALNHPSAMMRLSVVQAVGGYRSFAYPAEDLDLWLRLGEKGALANLPDAFLKYREHTTSISQQRHHEQLQRAKDVADQACDRRGIPRRIATGNVPFRPGHDRASRHAFSLRNGWWAFQSGERRTALSYAVRSVRLMPWRLGGWRLMASALLKPKRNPGDTDRLRPDAGV